MTEPIEAAVLLPCPFCGGAAELKDGYPYNIVKCNSCGARSFTQEDAIAAWNRRPAASGDLRERIARTFRALEELTAIVRGECPSLLNEDSGGSGQLSCDIDELLRDEDAILSALDDKTIQAEAYERSAAVAEQFGKPYALNTNTGAMMFRAETSKIAAAIRSLKTERGS